MTLLALRSDSLLTPKQKAIKIYAIETFMFFFRHHPNFEILQRQVLGRAWCRDMVGIPQDLANPVNFHTTYTYFHLLMSKMLNDN